MVTRVVFIRHAAIDAARRLCGSFDVALSPEGQEQVRALHRRAPIGAAPDALFTSTLRRATEVAVTLGDLWKLQPQAAEWAREIHCGRVEGMPLEQLRRELPDLWRRHEAQNDETFAWPGGETYAQFRSRVLTGLQAAVAAHSGGRLAVITHAGVISQVLGVIRERPASVWSLDRPAPFTATEIAWDNGAPRAIIAYNDPDWY